MKASKCLIDKEKIFKIRKILIEWGKKKYDAFPWRETENKFHALIAEIMLQRTRAEQVIPVFKLFSDRYQSPAAAVEDDPEKILDLMKSLGLEWRAKKIVEVIDYLSNRGGNIPIAYNELLELPGVGPYAASAFLSFHAGVRATIIDANVVRLWGRIFGFKTDGETRRKKWFISLADRMTPLGEFKTYNYAVLDFTRKICRPKPLCSECPLTSFCSYYEVQVNGSRSAV